MEFLKHFLIKSGDICSGAHIEYFFPFYWHYLSCQVHLWDRWFQSLRSYPRVGIRPRIFQSSSSCIETKSIKLANWNIGVLALMYNFQNCFEKFNWNIKAWFIVCSRHDILCFPFNNLILLTNSNQYPVLCHNTFITILHFTEQQRGQVPGGPGGAVLQPAQRQEEGADDQVHQDPDPVQSRWPHQGGQQHPDRRRGGGRGRSEELKLIYTLVIQ